MICAWCPDFNPYDPANADISHGICQTEVPFYQERAAYYRGVQ